MMKFQQEFQLKVLLILKKMIIIKFREKLVSQDKNNFKGEIEDEYTPKLFSEEHNKKILNKKTLKRKPKYK